MEENVGTFNDWEALVVEEFDSKTIQDHVSISCINDPSDNINVVLDDQSKKSPSSSSSEVEFRGSIAERRAAKFGFDASRIDVAKFKASCPPSLSPVPSPYLTIPPGISPAALLDSPIMLPNCQVQQSPTTGTLQLLHCNHDSLVLNSESPAADRDKGSAIHNSTLVKPPDEPTLMFPLSAEFQLPTNSRSPGESRNIVAAKSCFIDRSTETKISEKMHQKSNNINLQPLFDISIVKNQLPQLREGIKGETGIHELHQDDQKVTYPTASEMTRNAEDGYSWRKYGQKHVKGSEYPRSYYKCNNSNCPVKKKVERSHDGEITEIIYKGAHNHPKPHPRVSLGSSAQSSEMLETSEGSEAGLKVESGTGRRLNNQLIKSNKDFRVSSDRRPDDMERTSSTSVLTEALDPFTAIQGKSAKVFRLTETPEIASTVAYPDGEDEDRATQGSTSQGDEADGDESEPKRRKKEAFSTEAYLPSRSTREPRVIVQIESEIDVLDDGYRWRKYGQKVVKGNPNPRSYYKCTSAGCPVRKHVERASDDIKSVLTTYEGKHNHEVPTTKTSTGLPTASSLAPDIRDPNPSLMPRNPNVSNLEMHVQDLPLHYEMKPAVLGNHDFLRYNLLGDFVTDHMQIGASSIYQMKFPPTTLQSSIPYGSFLMNSNANESRASCQKFPPVFPDFPVSIPMNVARSSPNVALSNTFHSFNHNQAIISNGTAVQSSLGGDQHIEEGDLRFLRPKEEKKEDSLYETCLTNPDNANASSTIFYQAI